MQLETKFVEEMVELFSDTPFANGEKGEKGNEYFELSYERLSAFFRNQHRLLVAGDLAHIFPAPDTVQEEGWKTDDDVLNHFGNAMLMQIPKLNSREVRIFLDDATAKFIIKKR